MPKALTPDLRDQRKKEWAAFIRNLMKACHCNATVLAQKVGVSPWAVYRWLDPAPPPKGTLPTGSAQANLIRLAQEKGLVRK